MASLAFVPSSSVNVSPHRSITAVASSHPMPAQPAATGWIKNGFSVGSNVAGAMAIAAAGIAFKSASRRRHRTKAKTEQSALGSKGAVVFIDGGEGTTGLQVRERLANHPSIEVLRLDPSLRKDEAARRDALRYADGAVLCLPDAAAIAAVDLLGDAETVLVDASTAHRVSDGWVYGFAEMSADQSAAIAGSKRIANPGCYPTGFIGLVRPLVDAGIIPTEAELVIHAITGYSGGGQGLIDIYESKEENEPWGAYAFNLDHKHLPEMKKWTGLDKEPIFCPAVGNFRQGMVVSVPLRKSQLASGTTAADVQAALAKHYANSKFVSVAPVNPVEELERGGFMRPDTLNNTNRLELFVFGNEEKETMWICARLDNLGKGASGACVQNLNLAFGFEEAIGL